MKLKLNFYCFLLLTTTDFVLSNSHGHYKHGRNNFINKFSNYENTNCVKENESCKTLLECPVYKFNNLDYIDNCVLSNGKKGICCPSTDYLESETYRDIVPISLTATKDIFSDKFDFYPNADRRKDVYFNYKDRSMKTETVENELSKIDCDDKKSVRSVYHRSFYGYSKNPLKKSKISESDIDEAYNYAYRNYNNFDREIDSPNYMRDFKIEVSREKNRNCKENIVCKNLKYRTIDGSCNNKKHPSWGKTLTMTNRVVEPDYGDGISSMKLSTSKKELPNARDVSLTITRHVEPPKSKKTILVPMFGQFLDHDIALTATTTSKDDKPIECCSDEVQNNPKKLKHPACIEIKISKHDPFYHNHNVTCLNLVRSAPAKRTDCKYGPREQLNEVTSFVDCSQLYGNSLELSKKLRLFERGMLVSSMTNGLTFLPEDKNGTCNVPEDSGKKCFLGGDVRTNENIELTAMQTLFFREHNRIAAELEYLNPSWSDQKLFEETRAIIIGIVQNIVYQEYIPALLSLETRTKFNLLPTENDYSNCYDKNINPSIFSSFSTAAYRLHSAVDSFFQLRNSKDEIIGGIPISDTFNNPTLLKNSKLFDSLLYGMTSQNMQKIDQFFTTELTNKLFRPFNETFGSDLFARNIQRGRDHGLPSYNKFREICGLEKINSFADLKTVMPKKVAKIFKTVYDSVDDIDLFAAGVNEIHLENSEFGPTFSCLIGEQFRRLKCGDRYFYENKKQFTLEQLNEIKKVTLARIICENGNNIEYVQPHVFIEPTFWWNKKISCESKFIPKISLKPWAE